MSQYLTPKEGFKFGCDPELFIFDSNGNPVSAAGLIPGTKEEPYRVEGGAVQVDGMAAEFNINPVENFLDWNKNISTVIGQLHKMLPRGHTLQAVPSVVFPESAWDSTPDEAKVLGCNPDFNAWTGACNPPPNDPENPRMRCAAGHIHLGWTQDADLTDLQHILNCRDMVKQLDWYLGGWSLRMDSDPNRRRLYGKAGACRYKSYGVEYRTLSNFWVMTRDRRLSVWNRMVQAIDDMSRVFMPDKALKSNDALVKAIDSSTPNQTLERHYRYPLRSIGAM